MKLFVEIPLLFVSMGFMFVIYGTSINDQIFANNGWVFLITGVMFQIIIFALAKTIARNLIQK